MEYVSVICDECGVIKAYVADIGWAKANELLKQHPEWYCTTV